MTAIELQLAQHRFREAQAKCHEALQALIDVVAPGAPKE